MEPPPTTARPVKKQETKLRDFRRPPADDNFDFVAFEVAGIRLISKHARAKTGTSAEADNGQRSRDPAQANSDYRDDDHFRFGLPIRMTQWSDSS
jgi:hypothetical protein